MMNDRPGSAFASRLDGSMVLPPAMTFVVENPYGSDSDGLIWGYLFTPGQPAREIDAEGAARRLAKPDAGDSFVWLHFSLSNAASQGWLCGHLQPPDSFREALHQVVGSTRLEQEDDALVAVIHDVEFDFSFDPSSISTVNLWIQPRLAVSARLKPLRSLDRLRAAIKAGATFRSPADLLARLLSEQANVLVDIVRKATSRVDVIEDQLLVASVSPSRGELGNLRRTLVRLQRLLAPEPAAFFRLLSRPPAWIAREDGDDLRHSAEEFSAAVAGCADLGARVKLLQEEIAAAVNEQSSRTLFVLTVVTVLALPINITTGLFGMNVGGIPFAVYGHGFLLIVTLLIAITALLAYLAFGRLRKRT